MSEKPMKMTTVSLPSELEGKVVAYARSRRISKSAAIRIMISAFLSRRYRKTIVDSQKLEG